MDQSATMGVAHTSTTVFDTATHLDFWSQTAPRDWVAYGMCFEHHGGRPERERAINTLLTALRKLAEHRPKYAGRLQLSRDPEKPGLLVWTPSTSGIDANFKDISNDIDETYEELRARGFPASFFHNPRFFVLGINPNPADATQSERTPPAGTNGAAAASTPEIRAEVPAVAIRGFFIKGGLVLQVCLHHAFGDGYCMRDFLEDFAAETRGEMLRPLHDGRKLQLPLDFLHDLCPKPLAARGETRETREARARRLAGLCPEYTFDPQWFTGPTQPYRLQNAPAPSQEADCRVLSIKKAKLDALRRCLRMEHAESPTEYVALSTLLWAYITLHRSEQEGRGREKFATLSNPVNWKRNLSDGPLASTISDYFGNATAKCLTHVEYSQLVKAARQSSAVSRKDDASLKGEPLLADLRNIAAAIRRNIDDVDERFVAVRTCLYKALPDPRNLGLVDNPQSPAYMQFNTWKPFGADARFRIPGVPEDSRGAGATCAESIRKVMMGKQFDFRNVLIMPARRDSDETEIMVSLPTRSLAALLKDQGFTRWFTIRC